MPNTFRERIKSVSKSESDPLKSSKIIHKLKNQHSTIVTPGCIYFLWNSYQFFDDFARFWHPELEQSNTGSDKNECVSMHFRMSVDGMGCLPLQHRWSCVLVLIWRRIGARFGSILQHFWLSSENPSKVYEWPMKQFENCNFHHFSMRFWHGKNLAQANVWWISWKINIKFNRRKIIHFRVICIRVSRFLSFSCDLAKTR